MVRIASLLLIALVVAACAGARPDESAFDTANAAIAAAERLGAEELAPVELRFARDKLVSARRGMDNSQFDVALWLIEESEINSELAIEKSRAALARRKANELRRSNEILLEELRSNYGEDFE